MTDILLKSSRTRRETLHAKPDPTQRGATNPFEEQDKVSVRLITYPAGSITEYHNHNDIEFWTVISGSLRIWMDDHQIELNQGDSVRVEPLQIHRIESPREDTIMHAVWWTDAAYFADAAERSLEANLDGYNPVIVHPPMITPNGEMHLGHASGPFLQADFAARALRSAGREVLHLQGCQGHLQYLRINAEKHGGEFYEVAGRYTDSIRESLGRLNIDFDLFLECEQPKAFDSICHRLLSRLDEANLLAEIERDAPFDEEMQEFRIEALARGVCPHCHSAGATSECESCGATIIDADLGEVTDYQGKLVGRRKLKRLFLRTELLRDAIRQYAASALLPTRARLYIEKWLAGPLPDVCLSNPYSEGIAVARPGFEDQKYTDVLERVVRYLFALEAFGARHYGVSRFEELRPEQSPTTVALFGADNAFGRLVLFPALMIALGLGKSAPRMVVMNEFLLLNGEKFSTSRNHAVWVNEFIDGTNADPFRFYIARNSPVGQQVDFLPQEFDRWLTDHWQGQIIGTLSGALAFLRKNMTSRSIPMPGAWSRDDVNMYMATKAAMAAIRNSFDLSVLDFSAAARHVETLVDGLSRYLHSAQTRSDKMYAYSAPQFRTEARLVAAALVTIGVAIEPIAPRFGKHILSQFPGTWRIDTWFPADFLTTDLSLGSTVEKLS